MSLTIQLQQPNLCKSFDLASNAVVVDIMDNGSGVPEAIQSRIFEPFYTTKGVEEGTDMIGYC